MSLLTKAALIGVAAVAITANLTPPASPVPDDPCATVLPPVCALIPVLPDLDHDVDLTKPSNGGAPGSDAGLPAGTDHDTAPSQSQQNQQ